MEVDTVFSGVSIGVLLLGVVAVVVAYYKANLGNTIIKHQSELIATLTERVEILTTELGDHRTTVDNLKQKNSYLEGIVTGKHELTALLQEVQGVRRDVSTLESLIIATGRGTPS